MLKVGDKVFSEVFGKGVIVEVDTGTLPYLVKFNESNHHYLHTGVFCTKGAYTEKKYYWCDEDQETDIVLDKYEKITRVDNNLEISASAKECINELMKIKVGDKVIIKFMDSLDHIVSPFKFSQIGKVISIDNNGGANSLVDLISIQEVDGDSMWYFFRHQLEKYNGGK